MTSMLLFVTETYCGWSNTRNFLQKLILCLHGDHHVKEIEILQQRHWGISGLEPPPDRPVCGVCLPVCVAIEFVSEWGCGWATRFWSSQNSGNPKRGLCTCNCSNDVDPGEVSHLYIVATGITGHVKLDDNLDRLGEYSLWHKPSITANYQPFVEIKMESSHIDDIVTQTRTHTCTSVISPWYDNVSFLIIYLLYTIMLLVLGHNIAYCK